MAEISIVLPVYNGEMYLRDSIESIISQTFKDWELIIVDDCSTDRSPLIMEEYAQKDKRIILVHNKENKRLPEALNIGFEHAKGEFYTWTSDDNMYYSTALEEMRNFLKYHEESSMVVANMDMIDESGIFIRRIEYFDQDKICYANNVGACFMYRKTLAKDIGKYNSDMFGVEDYEYWLRIRFQNKEISHIDKCLYKYRVHNNSLTKQKKEMIHSNLWRMKLMYLDRLLPLLNKNEDLILKLYCELKENIGITSEQERIFKNNSRVISSIARFSNEKKTVIYGAGKYGCKASCIIENVIAFVDRDESKIGREKNGIKIISINELRRLDIEYQIIVALHMNNLYSALNDLIDDGFGSFCIIQDVLNEMGISYQEFDA